MGGAAPGTRTEDERVVRPSLLRRLRPSRSTGSESRSPSFLKTMVDTESASFPQEARLPSDGEDDRPVWSLFQRPPPDQSEQSLDFTVLTPDKFEALQNQESSHSNVKQRIDCGAEHTPWILTSSARRCGMLWSLTPLWPTRHKVPRNQDAREP